MNITTPDGQCDYIFNDWPTFAAYAYSGFQKYGRGILAIECSLTEATDDIKYWHEAAAQEAGVGEQVASYDPEQEILVVFIFPDDNQFARFCPDNLEFAPPLMAAQAPDADELWQDAE
ncbi:MAG: hypothetical protein IAF02_19725 [Anaerolineae bacterium]|nr:hypothetical protein [Anaerolineae bacterium]